MAEGLLPVFIGRATKIMEYLDLDYKTYRCRAKLGITTDTHGCVGRRSLEQRSTAGITESEDIREKMELFRGRDHHSCPPNILLCAVKGKRLYEYARDGQDVEIKPRRVRVSRLEIKDIDMEAYTVTFDVTCSKGTYVRSICHDLGEALGCGGSMEALRRTASGVFTLENAVSPQELKTMGPDEIEKRLLDMDLPLRHLGKAEMSRDRAKYFCSGNGIRWHQIKVRREPDEKNCDKYNSRGRRYSDIYTVYESESGRFLGIGYRDQEKNVLKADKILTAV